VFGRIRRIVRGPRPVDDATELDFPAVAYARDLKSRVALLPGWQQAAFAAACAERLYPAYAAFRAASGTADDGVVRRALDLAWDGAAGGVVDEADPAAVVERLVALIPREGDAVAIPDHADDAIAAAAYALQAAAGLDDQAAGWAAQRGTDALDSYLLSSDSVPWSAETREGRALMDQRVWQHPLVQAEVARREDDLARLAAGDREAAVRHVRASAMNLSLLPLDQLDHEP
jgi:uncharacterized protein YjaG (DUF416 family)